MDLEHEVEFLQYWAAVEQVSNRHRRAVAIQLVRSFQLQELEVGKHFEERLFLLRVDGYVVDVQELHLQDYQTAEDPNGLPEQGVAWRGVSVEGSLSL